MDCVKLWRMRTVQTEVKEADMYCQVREGLVSTSIIKISRTQILTIFMVQGFRKCLHICCD